MSPRGLEEVVARTPVFATCSVYCGASTGNHPKYLAATEELGQLLADRGTRIIYGGGHMGLMGALADSALACGGEVVGVIPTFMQELERGHKGLTRMDVVQDMQTRKLSMIEQGRAFIGLPGGIGTLEELLEVIEWLCSNRHDKPVGVLDLDGIYAPLQELLHLAVEAGYVSQARLRLFIVASTPVELLRGMEAAFLETLPVSGAVYASTTATSLQQGVSGYPKTPSGTACGVLVDDTGGIDSEHKSAVALLGRLLAEDSSEVVYGGGQAGLAGTLADSALAAGGRVVGIRPGDSQDIDAHPGITEICIARLPGPHARKRQFFERSARVVAVPGGPAVWEELLELLSAAQLGGDYRPMVVLNTGGFYSPLIRLVERTVECGFTQREFLNYISVATRPEEVCDKLRSYAPKRIAKTVSGLPPLVAPLAKL